MRFFMPFSVNAGKNLYKRLQQWTGLWVSSKRSLAEGGKKYEKIM